VLGLADKAEIPETFLYLASLSVYALIDQDESRIPQIRRRRGY
jgi:hypothetical protein